MSDTPAYGPEGRAPKFDYDGDAFYDEVYALAHSGMTDKEIAAGLVNAFGRSLSPVTFGAMKNGRYPRWTEEENSVRSDRIKSLLSRARARITAVVRMAYLKLALGGKVIKSRTSMSCQRICRCGGRDPECPECGGTGVIPITGSETVRETETELPPNLNALGRWLYYHDPEWRKIEDEMRRRPGELAAASADAAVDTWIEKQVLSDAPPMTGR